MPRPIPLLLVLSREALSLTQQELTDLVGSSLRTVQRWENKRASPSAEHIHKLADAVRPHDTALASELDQWAPRPAPPPPPPPAVIVAAPRPEPEPPSPSPPPPPPPEPPPPPSPPPPIPDVVLVDSVVCAAAEAMSMLPNAIRPALLAAFARARDARLTPEAVVAVLAPPEPEAPVSKATGAKKGT